MRQSRLQRQTDAFRQKVLAMEAESTRLLSATYADALTVLEPRILALSKQIEEARANGQEPNISWLFQQERYQELRRQLITLMDQYGATTKLVTTEAQKVIVREALQHAGEMLLPVSGGSGSEIATLARGWAAVPDQSIIELVGAIQDGTPVDAVIRSYGTDSVQAVQQALTRGLALGDSAQMTTQVIRALGVTRARAESLVRTETLRAARSATMAAYEQSGVVTMVRWSASLSARTCGYCLSRHGKLFPLGTVMASHPNCFPAGTLVSGPLAVASSKRWYDGDLLDIRFGDNELLSVTPNHPILTPHGWVAAGLLNKGDEIIRQRVTEGGLPSIGPNNHRNPAFIEDVAESLSGSLFVSASIVPTSSKDFHGDGCNSEISVIRTNGELGGRRNAALLEPTRKSLFVGRDVVLSNLVRMRPSASLIPTLNTTFGSLVRFCSEHLALFGGGLSHPDVHAFGSAAGSHAGGYQSFADAGPWHAIAGSERFLRFPSEVTRHHLVNREDISISADHCDFADSEGFALFERPEQPSFTQDPNEPSGVGMEPLRSDLRTLTGKISIDRVLEVSVRRFRGHVYNLETTDGYYIANEIIVHNCRCSWSPYNPKWSDDWQSGESWLKEQPLTVQQDILGKLGAADFRAGNLQLSDFERTGFDKDWGPTGHFGGVEWARKQATKAGRAPSEWATAPPITRTVTKPKKAPKKAAAPASRPAPARGRDLTGEAFVEFLLDV